MTKHKKNVLALALTAAVVLCGGAFAFFQWHSGNQVASVISLDVNPSIELEINSKERIISANPLNEDAQVILSDMDLEGSSLSVGMKAILGSLLEHGYLDRPSSAILISVEDKDAHRAAYLKNTLADEADIALKNASSDASVLSQVIPMDEELKKEAHSHSISVGKANYIRKIEEQNKDLELAQLADLTAEELGQLLENGAGAMPIGRDEARKAALRSSGLKDSDVLSWEVDPELDEIPPHYEVDFITANGEYEYNVDAYTGEVYQGFTTPVEPQEPDSSADNITKDKAIAIALKNAGVGESSTQGLRCTLDWDDGVQKYEVDFHVGTMEYSYDIDAKTGKILKAEKEQDDDLLPVPDSSKPSTPSKPNELIGEAAAKKAALSHAGVSESKTQGLRCTLDWDDGIQKYEVDFYVGTMEYSYDIDAKTGKILKAEKEQDDDLLPVPDSSKPSTPSKPNELIGEAAAKKAALSHAGVSESKTQGLRCTLDWDDGIQNYDIEFYVGTLEYSYEIDAKTGKILKAEKETSDDLIPSTPSKPNSGAVIGESAAKNAALSYAGVSAGDAQGLRCTLDWDDGIQKYDVEFRVGGTEYEFEIDATSGAILKSESDIDD